MIDERTEHLISRKLDGELTADEALELNKALIRSPEYRLLLSEYERTTARAADALKAAFGETGGPRSVAAATWNPLEAREHGGMRYVTGLAAVVGVAAVIVAMIGPLSWSGPSAVVNPHGSVTLGPLEPVSQTPLIEGPRQEDQRIDRDVFGVYDQESRSLYLLEVDNTRSTTVPLRMNY